MTNELLLEMLLTNRQESLTHRAVILSTVSQLQVNDENEIHRRTATESGKTFKFSDGCIDVGADTAVS